MLKCHEEDAGDEEGGVVVEDVEMEGGDLKTGARHKCHPTQRR